MTFDYLHQPSTATNLLSKHIWRPGYGWLAWESSGTPTLLLMDTQRWMRANIATFMRTLWGDEMKQKICCGEDINVGLDRSIAFNEIIQKPEQGEESQIACRTRRWCGGCWPTTMPGRREGRSPVKKLMILCPDPRKISTPVLFASAWSASIEECKAPPHQTPLPAHSPESPAELRRTSDSSIITNVWYSLCIVLILVLDIFQGLHQHLCSIWKRFKDFGIVRAPWRELMDLKHISGPWKPVASASHTKWTGQRTTKHKD